MTAHWQQCAVMDSPQQRDIVKMHPDREDEQNVELAESLGWTIDRSTCTQRGITFRRGHTSIWAISSGWQVADLINGHHCNHRPESSLRDALNKEGS